MTESQSDRGDHFRYYLRADEAVPGCKASKEACIVYTVDVENASPYPLECSASMEPAPPAKQSPVVYRIETEKRLTILWKRGTDGAAAPEAAAHCVRGRPTEPDPLSRPLECEIQAVVEYPPMGRWLHAQGVVTVAFTLADANARPTEIVVVSSSTSPLLDEAAARAIENAKLSPACSGSRQAARLTIMFKES
jgi:TonB family protein